MTKRHKIWPFFLNTLYMHSILEYAAPVWSPCMSKTSLAPLQQIQNQAIRTILSTWLSTCIDALHFEASLPLLQIWYSLATAFCTEKYHQHPPNDPLNQITHQTLPPVHLKCSSWQYWSDQIWCSIGFYPARHDEHAPCPASHTSLSPQKPISFLPEIPPWDL